MIQKIFMIIILNKHDCSIYLKTFQNFRYSFEWSRIQNSIFYIWFWSFFEIERVELFMSLIFKKHISNIWFRQSFVLTIEKIMNITTIFVRTIVKIFEIIVNVNTMMNNQRYIFFDVLRTIVLKNKQTYQDLINCVIETTTKFDEKQTHDVDLIDDDLNFFANDFREKNLNFFANVFENENVVKMKNVLFAMKKSNDDVDVLKMKSEIRIVTRVRNKKRSFSKKKFKKFLIFFNVHAKLHLNEMTKKYVIVMNLNVLTEKMKHMWIFLKFLTNVETFDKLNRFSNFWQIKWFWQTLKFLTTLMNYKILKIMTNQTFLFNLMKYFFSRDVFNQFFKFDFAKFWNHDHSKIMKTLNLMNFLCFSFVQNFLFRKKQIINDENDNVRTIEKDVRHHCVQLFVVDFVLQNQFQIISYAKSMKFSHQYAFVQQLMNAYEQYIDRKMLHFESKSFKWFKKLIYTNE